MTSASDTRLTERQRSSRRPAAERQVWVLDDSPFEAEAVRRALSEDHHVTVFSDPAVMLEAWTSRSRPDVLVLDWELPGLSGLEVCRYLRATPGGDNLAIVMLTVHRRTEDVVQALEAGANDFVTKPFEAMELRARVGVHARSRDRLESERDQMAVERSQWQQVAEALPQLVWMTGPDGKADYFNQRWYAYTGARARECDGEGWLRFCHPEDVPLVADRWRQAVRSGSPYEVECRVRRHDGAWRWFLVRAQPLRDRTGAIARWLGTSTDMHGQKEAELRFRRITEAGIVSVVEWDASGALTYVNDAFLALLGYTREEADAGLLDFRKLTPPEYEEVTRQALATLQQTGIVCPFEKQYLRKDGTRVDVLISSATLNEARDRGIALLVDISETKRRRDFEQQLIGIVSHDLRSPLQTIVLSAGALLRRADELDEKTLKAASRIQTAGTRATRLVSDLLDFTRARLGGGIPLHREQIDLHELIRQLVDDLAAANPDRHLSLKQTGSAQGEWDSHRLAQIAENLIVNALRYSAPDAPVTVRTAGLDGWVELCVHNTGEPIPAELLQRLFEPFTRGASTPQSGQGVGLGLFIVDQLVRQHGGELSVHSTAAEGTTFKVRLPRTPPGSRRTAG